MAAVSAARLGDRQLAMEYLDESRWGYELGDRLIYAARVAIILGDADRALALVAQALDLGAPGYPWMHASGHHDFIMLGADPRISRLIGAPLG